MFFSLRNAELYPSSMPDRLKHIIVKNENKQTIRGFFNLLIVFNVLWSLSLRLLTQNYSKTAETISTHVDGAMSDVGFKGRLLLSNVMHFGSSIATNLAQGSVACIVTKGNLLLLWSGNC